MKCVKTIFTLLFLSVLVGCNSNSRTLPSSTGSIYECVVVAPATGCQAIVDTLAADMPCLPQMEPYFNLTVIQPQHFDDFLKSTRNIVYVDLDPQRYVEPRIHYYRDRYSHPQAYCRIQAPDTTSLQAWWHTHGTSVRQWLVREELYRQAQFLRQGTNKEARKALKQWLKCDMLIPEDYMLIKDTCDLVWCCNNKGPMRRDLLIYSYPYTSSETFTQSYLCHKRDSILSRHISASVAGSYMGTEYKVFPPQYRQIQGLERDTTSSFYGGELRGLWRIYQGEAMGGPFVSHSRIDMVNGRIVTAEVFVYAAGQKKRNALRQAEAILYTLLLPQDQRTEKSK